MFVEFAKLKLNYKSGNQNCLYVFVGEIPRRLVPVPERFLGPKRHSIVIPSQHLAEPPLEQSVIGGLIAWYLDVLAYVPIS
jgi:hypothetical protein